MPGIKAALLVGTAAYSDPKFQRLRAPVHDVEALARVLSDPAIGGFDVKTLIDQSSWIVSDRIAEFFVDRNRDDLLLLYFSCHGVKDESGRLHLAATNTRYDLPSANGISSSWVDERMDRSRSQRIVLMLDCCYSGAYTRGVVPRADSSAHVVEDFEGGLETGEADLDRDGWITINELYDYVYDHVRTAIPHQTPTLSTYGLKGELVPGEEPPARAGGG